MAISNEQLAELLVGIARSQNAIIEALVSHYGHPTGAFFRGDTVIPILQGFANIHDHDAQPTFLDLPSRLLLQLQESPQAGKPSLEEWLAQELERLSA